MISFEGFQTEDGSPVYRQILLYIKRGAVAGTVADGDELPSRRVLSALLGVNPNTVQKAYRLLEDEGLIRSHSGAKSYMVLDAARVERIRTELTRSEARALAASMKQMGLTKEQAIALIEQVWGDEE